LLATNCISAEYVEGFEAFSVGLTKSTSVMTEQHVLYDRVITVRDQASYDVSTGTFTASSTGIYIFHYHALASSNIDFHVYAILYTKISSFDNV
jgi:hypothetical protein